MKKFFKTLRNIIMASAFISIFWGAGFGWFAFKASTLKPYDLSKTTSAIVVLTGGEGRLDAGLNLFSAQRARFLFITSVSPTIDETDIRARWEGKTPLPECCIAFDHTAVSTAQNALMARKWLDETRKYEMGDAISSIRLVTSNYHMPRALIDFERLIPDVALHPHPIVSQNAKFLDKAYWTLLISEYHKYIFRLIQGLMPDDVQEQFA